MSFFDSLPKVNKLFVMRQALLANDHRVFAEMAFTAVMNGHLTMHELSAAFGRDMDNPDFNPEMCNPAR
jgi:hydroxymethylglutaryl-CoA reductase